MGWGSREGEEETRRTGGRGGEKCRGDEMRSETMSLRTSERTYK